MTVRPLPSITPSCQGERPFLRRVRGRGDPASEVACALPLLRSGPAGTRDSSAPPRASLPPAPPTVLRRWSESRQGVFRERPQECALRIPPRATEAPTGELLGSHGPCPRAPGPRVLPPAQSSVSCLHPHSGLRPVLAHAGRDALASVLSASCPLSYRDLSWEVITDSAKQTCSGRVHGPLPRAPFMCFPHGFPWTKPLVSRPFLTFSHVISSREHSPRGVFHQ